MFEAAADVGGTWWWNRYPGARCDIEAMDYSLLVLARARAGVDLDRALRHPARDPPLRRTTSPTASTCAATSGSRPGSTAATWRRRRRALGGRRPTAATPSTRRFVRHGDRLPVGGQAARDRRASTRFAGADVPHRPLAPRGRRLHRPAGRRDRHRLVGHPVDPADRRAGRAPHRVPAHAELRPAGAERARSTRRRWPSVKARYRGAPRDAAAPDARAGSRAARRPSPPWRSTPTSARRAYQAGWESGHAVRRSSAPSTTCCSTATANETAAEFVRDRIREIVDDPEVAETLLARRLPVRHQAALPRHRLLRDLQPRRTSTSSTSAATPIDEIVPTGVRTTDRRRTSSTRSCSPPASTP